MQPANYLLNIPNPTQDVMSSVGNALSLKAMQEQRQQNQMMYEQNMAYRGAQIDNETYKLQLIKEKEQRDAKYRAGLSSAIQEIGEDPNIKPERLFQLRMNYKELGESFDGAIKGLNAAKQQDLLGMSVSVENALMAGRNDLAEAEFDKRIEAAKQSGDKQTEDNLMANKKIIMSNPTVGIAMARNLQASILGADNYADNRSKMAEVGAKEAEAGLSNAQATKAKVEAAKIVGNAEVELDKDMRKVINDSVIQANKSNMLGDQYMSVADQIESKIDSSGLIAGKGVELVKKVFGTQNEASALRIEYDRLKNAAAMDSLPAGSASDADVALALSGFPPVDSAPKVLASFMRGMAKIQKYTAQVENEKADWVSKVGHLGATNKTIKIKGTVIEPGTRFTEYTAIKYGNAPSTVDGKKEEAVQTQEIPSTPPPGAVRRK